ncbi:MAG: hypothetical protein AAGD04_04130 [Pseudomonadota bacterium]
MPGAIPLGVCLKGLDQHVGRAKFLEMTGSRHTFAAALLAFIAATPMALACPALPDTSIEQARINARIKAAASEAEARALGGALWQIWTTAPDAKAQNLLDQGMKARSSFDYASSEAILDELVAYCPEYAEAWNQRAFTRYLRQDFSTALEDLDRTLALLPTHTGALTGKALTLIGMGRAELAQEVLKEALRVNPWLSERALLVKPKGTEL